MEKFQEDLVESGGRSRFTREAGVGRDQVRVELPTMHLRTGLAREYGLCQVVQDSRT